MSTTGNSTGPPRRPHRRRDPIEQAARDAYAHGIRLVYLALADEQDIGMFGTPPKDRRDLPCVRLAKVVLGWSTKPDSMKTGGCFAGMARLAREAGISKSMAWEHWQLIRERSLCFVEVSGRHRRRNSTTIRYPALDGCVLHPRAPGYNAEKLAEAVAAHKGQAAMTIPMTAYSATPGATQSAAAMIYSPADLPDDESGLPEPAYLPAHEEADATRAQLLGDMLYCGWDDAIEDFPAILTMDADQLRQLRAIIADQDDAETERDYPAAIDAALADDGE